MVSANFFISTANLPKTVEKTQSEVVQYDSILIPFRDHILLAVEQVKGRCSCIVAA
jgi:hypothetical protein